MINKKIIYGLTLASLGFAGVAGAAEFKPASVRSLGMGGSNVASTNGVDATYWNPAAYGFFSQDSAEMREADNNGMSDKDYGLDLGVGLQAKLFGPISANLNKLQNMNVPTGNAAAGMTGAEMVATAKFLKDFQSLDPATGGLDVAVDGTVGTRVFNYGLSVRTSIDANVSVTFDNQNAGLGANFLSAMTGNPTPLPPGTLYFTPAEQSAIANNLSAAGMTPANANNVAQNYNNALTVQSDPATAQAAGVAYDPTLAGNQAAMATAVVDLYTAPGDIQKNNTTVDTRGVALTEVGVTYGHAFDENLSGGLVLKYMQASMINDSILAFGNNTNVSNTQNAGTSETVTGVGLDLGGMYRMEDWQFGLAARNLNSPSFEHSSGYVYELKPQVKVGVAWIPTDTFTIEAGYDVTKNKGAVASSESQYWNAGLEWNMMHALALRVGAFQNMAQTDVGLVPTVGLGINLWAMRMDLAAAMSSKKVVLDGKDVPVYAAASLALAVDF